MKTDFWHQLLDLLSPRLCVVCGRRLSLTEQVLCVSCNMHLPRTAFHLTAYDNTLARLFWGIIPVERAAALFYYEADSKVNSIIYDLKYHDHPEIGSEMGRLMAVEFRKTGFFDGIDMIVPVPLARKRQWQRGYNQSLCIAKGISQVTGIPIYNKVVCRTKFVQSQTKIGRRDRQENVERVFRLKNPDVVRHRHILLVDDVITTGATMAACARELLKADDVKLSLLSLAFAK